MEDELEKQVRELLCLVADLENLVRVESTSTTKYEIWRFTKDNNRRECVAIINTDNGYLGLVDILEITSDFSAFGCDVAITPDGNRVVVGARNHSYTAANQGAIYIYQNEPIKDERFPVISKYVLKETIIPSDRSYGFGEEVYICADGTEIEVRDYNEQLFRYVENGKECTFRRLYN